MELLVGNEDIKCEPFRPYDDIVVDLLDDWSKEIKKNSAARRYPDVLTFGFFIRRGSIAKKKEEFENRAGEGVGFARLGRGLAFHVAPSNVPVNCMYTLVFGLLSGCANIVRVPTKEFKQVDILCETLNNVLRKRRYDEIGSSIQVLRYDRDEKLLSGELYTAFFSRICDVRVIWGGDETVADIRSYPVTPRAKDITFADRYSLGIISTKAVANATDDEIIQLASDFYNDTYLMDQNACSSPHLIGWLNDLEYPASEKDDSEISEQELVDPEANDLKKINDVNAIRQARAAGSPTRNAQDRFWRAVADVAREKYDLADIKVSEKFLDLCEAASRDVYQNDVGQVIGLDYNKMDAYIMDFKSYGNNAVYVCDLEVLTRQTVEKLRGRFGTFFQKIVNQVRELRPAMDDPKVQTCAVYGVEPEMVKNVIVENRYYGVDRVVPFGHTLDIDVIWDGYDLIGEMSRIIASK